MVALHRKYEPHGLKIAVFPCNQFGGQEQGSAAEIKEFTAQRGVNFHVMGKVDVNGPGTCDTYRFLKTNSGTGDLQWNFGRYFLVSKTGRVRAFEGSPLNFETTLSNMLAGVEEPDL